MNCVCRFVGLPVRGFAGLRRSSVVSSPTRQPANPPTGFSLIELVISMAILSGGVVAAMRIFPVGLRASQRAQRSSLATLAAQRTLEALKLKPWNELVETDTTTTEGEFRITTHIHTPQVAHLMDPARLKAIEVTVEWTQEGRTRALEFVTYLRRSTS